MNERIRQLARQSTGASTIYMLEEEWLKFAELIVKECASLVVGDPAFILEHFGIEL